MIHRISGLMMPETGKECASISCCNCALAFDEAIKKRKVWYGGFITRISTIRRCVFAEAV